MKRRIYLSLIACLMTALAFSQTRQVTGRVISDSARDGVAGATVTVKGSGTITATDNNGRYSISVPERGATLVFSSVGYNSAEVAVGTRSEINVTLRTSSGAALSDVVVVGYSTMRRRDLTGSVSSVGARQLKDIPLTSAAEALAGRLAGVNVTTTEGAPGAEVRIRVRGGGSITQDNSPIYIVDGIQVEDALSTLSPQDIQSIDVLKDASTTAIYGARGANGVVIITTKSGRPGKTIVNYNGGFGFRQLSKKMDVLNPYDFVQWQYERAAITGDTAAFFNTYGRTWDTLNVYKNVQAIDWQEELFGRRAGYQNHNVSVSGGSQNTTYNLSLTSSNETGIMLESGFDRKIAAFKLDHRASDKFRIGLNIRYTDQIVRGAGTADAGSRTLSRLRNAIQYRPFELTNGTVGIDDFDELYYSQSNLSNPVILAEAEYRRRNSKALNLGGYFTYQLLPNLTFRSNLGYNTDDRRSEAFNSKITGTARQYSSLPTASIGTLSNSTINISNTLQYNKQNIGNKHDLDLLIGQEIYELRSQQNFTETRYFPADITPEKALANMQLGSSPDPSLQQPLPTSYVAPANRLFSLFGRANYAYDDKYLATFSLRGDRSSKFIYDNGLLFFPSASVAWRISKEKFFEPVNFISDAKIRFGYGTAGNNRIGDLLYLQLFGVTGQYSLGDVVRPALAPRALANPGLKWETTITRNLGFDLGFLNNRLSLTVDLYHNSTKDLLLDLPIPPTTGYDRQIKNVASTSNKGIEIQLNAEVVQKRNFTWSSNFNISFNKNRVDNLGPITQQTVNTGLLGRDGADEYLLAVGQPLGLMYGFVTDGYYKIEDFDYNSTTGVYTLKPGQPNTALIFGNPAPGTIKLRNLGGDSLIRVEDDRTIIGNAQPKFIGGWNNQFTFKNFDASIFVNWMVGHDIFNANKIEWTDGSFANLNMLDIMKNRWRNIDDLGNRVTDPVALAKLNENVSIWSPTRANRYYIHSWAIEDGSFLRINNITLGYTLPESLTKRAKISRLRIYATVNNLATITGYTGYDPEIDTRRGNPLTPGVDMAGYPRSRAWVFGANVTF